jgi:hypothetical protein
VPTVTVIVVVVDAGRSSVFGFVVNDNNGGWIVVVQTVGGVRQTWNDDNR